MPPASAQLDNGGTLFYAGFMQNYGGSTDRYLELSIASDLITTGTVSSNAGFSQTFSVTPGTVTSVIVPQTHMHLGRWDGSGYHPSQGLARPTLRNEKQRAPAEVGACCCRLP